jgi:hypothetical protein
VARSLLHLGAGPERGRKQCVVWCLSLTHTACLILQLRAASAMHSFNLVQQPRRASVGAPRGRLRTQVLAVVKEQVSCPLLGSNGRDEH